MHHVRLPAVHGWLQTATTQGVSTSYTVQSAKFVEAWMPPGLQRSDMQAYSNRASKACLGRENGDGRATEHMRTRSPEGTAECMQSSSKHMPFCLRSLSKRNTKVKAS